MATQVRRFAFFNKQLVKDPETRQPFTGFQAIGVTCSASGRGLLVFGDSDGFIHEVDRQLNFTSFQAYELTCTHLYQMRQHNLLISAGVDGDGSHSIKIWNLDKVDRIGAPHCVRTIQLNTKGKSVAVTCVTAHEDLSLLAVGMKDGSVHLVKGDISRDRYNTKTPKIIRPANPVQSEPVNFLGFWKKKNGTILYIATNAAVEVYSVETDRMEQMDTDGCDPRCAVMGADGTLVVGREKCIYFFSAEGRGGALAFEGPKTILGWFRNYLVLVTDTSSESGMDGPANRINTLTVYDTRNKFIAFTSGGFKDINYVLSEWGALFVLTADGQLYQLAEKDFQSKLEMLFKKNLYDIAINLAKTQEQDGSEANHYLIDIYSRYANHLYNKGNYDAAISQYIKTIGKLEPSHVIRKFLDSQRINNLTDYLQALHEKELADKHHTTLLLNCYTKLKRVDKLDEFIKTERNLNFDLETAIIVCRQAGYYTHALYLAQKFDQHDWYLKVQLEDVKDYGDALEYISQLNFEEAEKNLKVYGKELVNHRPEEVTELLQRLCSGKESDGFEGQMAKPDEFIHIYVNQVPSLLKFLEHMVRERSDCGSQVYDTLLELYLRGEGLDKEAPNVERREQWILELLQNPNAQYDDYHAIVLAQIYDFKPGILYLYEKAKQYQQIVQYYMEKNAYADIVDACKKYGTADRSLWVQALSYFAGKEEDCKEHIREVLSHIDKRNLLPPLMVVDALAMNSTATLSVVKDYITRRLQQENDAIAEDERLIKKDREETEKMRKEIEELKSKAKIFQDLKCSNCKSQLELPAIHFLCGHSYHQHCLVDDSGECNQCAKSREQVKGMVRNQQLYSEQHELFFKQLEGADNKRFSVVADYFGRGVFNKQPGQKGSPTRVPGGREFGDDAGGMFGGLGDNGFGNSSGSYGGGYSGLGDNY